LLFKISIEFSEHTLKEYCISMVKPSIMNQNVDLTSGSIWDTNSLYRKFSRLCKRLNKSL